VTPHLAPEPHLFTVSPTRTPTGDSHTHTYTYVNTPGRARHARRVGRSVPTLNKTTHVPFSMRIVNGRPRNALHLLVMYPLGRLTFLLESAASRPLEKCTADDRDLLPW